MLERLQKIIARAGIASRRHAEELIRGGQVRVNGVVVTELGAKADPERDRVEAAGQVAEKPGAPEYYVLNKPAHVVSTMSDPEGRGTLRHLLRGLSGGVFPVGRLDYAASGLVLLTTDGEFGDRIFKNSARMPQVYWVKVKGKLSDNAMRELRAKAHARLRPLRAPGSAAAEPDNPWYEVEMSDARRDLLRNALFASDHPVEKMRRVKFGPVELGGVAESHYRKLDDREVAQLRAAIERAEKAPHVPAKKRVKRFFRRPEGRPGPIQEQNAGHGPAQDGGGKTAGETEGNMAGNMPPGQPKPGWQPKPNPQKKPPSQPKRGWQPKHTQRGGSQTKHGLQTKDGSRTRHSSHTGNRSRSGPGSPIKRRPK